MIRIACVSDGSEAGALPPLFRRLDGVEFAGSWRSVSAALGESGRPFDAILSLIWDADGLEAALNRGLHSLAPPAAIANLQENSLSAGAGAGSPVVMAAHPWRYRPAVEVMIRRLSSGALGAPGLLRIHHWEPGSRRDTHPECSGPELLPLVDTALLAFSSEPRTIFSVRRPGFLQVHLGFPGDGMAIIDLVRTLPETSAPYQSLSLIGSAGAVYADDHRDMQLALVGGAAEALKTSSDDPLPPAMIQEFANAIRGKSKLSVSAEDARTAVDVTARALAANGFTDP